MRLNPIAIIVVRRWRWWLQVTTVKVPKTTNEGSSDGLETLDTVLRRAAKSGKVSYADPVVLQETSRTRVSFVPFFIPHSDHTELAGAIVTEKKAPPPMDFVVSKKSISLEGQN